MNADQLRSALEKAKNRPERNLWFGAMLARDAKTRVVIVGGSAIEVYTSGQYVSGDIDVVGEREPLIDTLERWGFQRKGRLWARADLELWVDPVGRHYNGDEERLQVVTTPYGQVRLAAIEDLIAKRLIEVKVWPQGAAEMFSQAVALASEYENSVDWDYVTTVARRERAEDLVPELRRRVAASRATSR